MRSKSNLKIDDLKSVTFLENIKRYLVASTWNMTFEIPNVASYWGNSIGEEYVEIHLPESLELRDYDNRILEALNLISKIEKSTQLDIFESIVQFRSDKINIKVVHQDTEMGLIPLEAGVQLHKCVLDVLTFASLSTFKKQKYFQGPRDAETLRMLDSLKLAQSSIGSYIVNVVIPLPTNVENDLFEVSSFQRYVSNTLDNSLNCLQEYVAIGSDEPSLLFKYVEKGVSANMCEALAGISGEDSQRDFTITIEYSQDADLSDSNAVSYNFKGEDAELLRHASNVLKGNYVQNGYIAVGLIKRLDRDISKDAGEVTVVVSIDGADRSVKIDLNADQYTQAIRAHEDKIVIECVGNLVVAPRIAKLIDIRSFRLLENDDLLG